MITKKVLAEHICENHSILGDNQAVKIVDEMFEMITEALAKGEVVRITNFGTFKTGMRKGRQARNPATQEMIDIPAKTIPKFSPGKKLREIVNI